MGKRKKEKITLRRKKAFQKAHKWQAGIENPYHIDFIGLENQIILLDSEYGHMAAYLKAIKNFFRLPESSIDISFKERCKEIIPMLEEAFSIIIPKFKKARGIYNVYFTGIPKNKSWPKKLEILKKRCQEEDLDKLIDQMIKLREICIKISNIFPIEEILSIKCSFASNKILDTYQTYLYACNYMQQQEFERYRSNPARYGIGASIFEAST